MAKRTIGRSMLAGMLVGTFAVGFFCGSVSQQRADAQVKDLGGALMKQATGSGGALGSAAELGTSIVEMQEHVTGLQKNIDTLKKVQSALTGQQQHAMPEGQPAANAVGSAPYAPSISDIEGNKKLSLASAQAVKESMVKSGIDASRITMADSGQEKPITSNDTEDRRAKNRRKEGHEGLQEHPDKHAKNLTGDREPSTDRKDVCSRAARKEESYGRQ